MSTTTETQNKNGQDNAAVAADSTASTQPTPEVEGYRVSSKYHQRVHITMSSLLVSHRSDQRRLGAVLSTCFLILKFPFERLCSHIALCA